MSGNTFGYLFRVTTAGESHGKALTAIIDGCPASMALTEADIQVELDRRKPGQSKFVSQRRERDAVEILSGIFEGCTTGAPITLLVKNEDQRSKDYSELKDKFRPGHADFTYWHKYGIRDYRGSGRASARETVMRVAAGAVAKKYLREQLGLEVNACVMQIGPIIADEFNAEQASQNPFFFSDNNQVDDLEKYLTELRREGDSIGTKIQVQASPMPIGLGEPVFDKLNARIASALMSINAAKAVEIGDGFQCVTQKGSEHRDELSKKGFKSNHAGGVLGGISSGQTVIANVAFKPTSSITKLTQTITTNHELATVSTKGRHDPCVGIRAVPIVEAMVALALMDFVLIASLKN